MTYRRLIDSLSRIPANRLNDDVTIYIIDQDAYVPVLALEIADEDRQDVLDDGHPYLTVKLD